MIDRWKENNDPLAFIKMALLADGGQSCARRDQRHPIITRRHAVTASTVADAAVAVAVAVADAASGAEAGLTHRTVERRAGSCKCTELYGAHFTEPPSKPESKRNVQLKPRRHHLKSGIV